MIGALPSLPPLPSHLPLPPLIGEPDDNAASASHQPINIPPSLPPPIVGVSSSATAFASLMSSSSLGLASASSHMQSSPPSWLSAMGSNNMMAPFNSLPSLPSLSSNLFSSSSNINGIGLFAPSPSVSDDPSSTLVPPNFSRDAVGGMSIFASLTSLPSSIQSSSLPSPEPITSAVSSSASSSHHPLDNAMGVGMRGLQMQILSSSMQVSKKGTNDTYVPDIAIDFTNQWLQTKRSWQITSPSISSAKVASHRLTTPTEASTLHASLSIWQLVMDHSRRNRNNGVPHEIMVSTPIAVSTMSGQHWDDAQRNEGQLPWWKQPHQDLNGPSSRPPLGYIAEAGNDAFATTQRQHMSHSQRALVEVVSENELVRDCLYALQGVPSKTFVWSNDNKQFEIRSCRLSNGSVLSMNHALNTIGHTGTKFARLEQLGHWLSSAVHGGLVGQAFGEALLEYLSHIRLTVLQLPSRAHRSRQRCQRQALKFAVKQRAVHDAGIARLSQRTSAFTWASSVFDNLKSALPVTVATNNNQNKNHNKPLLSSLTDFPSFIAPSPSLPAAILAAIAGMPLSISSSDQSWINTKLVPDIPFVTSASQHTTAHPSSSLTNAWSMSLVEPAPPSLSQVTSPLSKMPTVSSRAINTNDGDVIGVAPLPSPTPSLRSEGHPAAVASSTIVPALTRAAAMHPLAPRSRRTASSMSNNTLMTINSSIASSSSQPPTPRINIVVPPSPLSNSMIGGHLDHHDQRGEGQPPIAVAPSIVSASTASVPSTPRSIIPNINQLPQWQQAQPYDGKTTNGLPTSPLTIDSDRSTLPTSLPLNTLPTRVDSKDNKVEDDDGNKGWTSGTNDSSNLTLVELLVHSRAMALQLDQLSRLCSLHIRERKQDKESKHDIANGEANDGSSLDYSNFPRGAALLSFLYDTGTMAALPNRSMVNGTDGSKSKGNHGNGECSPVIRYLFHRAAQPYLRMLHEWIYHGELIDPFHEFMVTRESGSLSSMVAAMRLRDARRIGLLGGASTISSSEGDTRFVLRYTHVPSFLTSVSSAILSCGQTLSVLRRYNQSIDVLTRCLL
jgi:hypothetical protein